MPLVNINANDPDDEGKETLSCDAPVSKKAKKESNVWHLGHSLHGTRCCQMVTGTAGPAISLKMSGMPY